MTTDNTERMIDREPILTVGLMERRPQVQGRLNGTFRSAQGEGYTGRFTASATGNKVIFSTEGGSKIVRPKEIEFIAEDQASFLVAGVTIGIDFHWQREDDLVFQGGLRLLAHEDDTLTVINKIGLENYLASVIASEMSETAPPELLKAHAIMSRSWLTAMLQRKEPAARIEEQDDSANEIIRWYGREDHRDFDVCADDHCQRYQGITRTSSGRPAQAVAETRGLFLVFDGAVCDARYYKACGGLTDNFENAWEDRHVPFLTSITDGPSSHQPIQAEEDASKWLLASPDAYCNVADKEILRQILPAFDQSTGDFFRWRVTYTREELELILREKSGIDFGTLTDLIPLSRGPSGRIYRLMVKGTKRTVVVGKELEIRRWLSRSHLLSSAFVVFTENEDDGIPNRFILKGGGWGHGVGLCQIGAAVMALRGFSATDILHHYFRGTQIRKLY
jgi:stage II sporulation protein D